MLYIIIGNIAVYLFSFMDRTSMFISLMQFDAGAILRGEVWRVITFMFIPVSTSPLWLAISLYFYYFISSTLERQWGSGKFTIYYLSGVLFLVVFGFAAYLLNRPVSGGLFTSFYLNLGMLFVFATFYPDLQMLLMFIIPIKVKWIALLDLGYFIIAILTLPQAAKLLPVIILLHYFIFCGGWLIDFTRSLLGPRSRPAQKSGVWRTVSFKHEVKKAQRDRRSITRQCSVCGRTDTDHPNMDFRFCSRCEGYHCFCEEHINNHQHYSS